MPGLRAGKAECLPTLQVETKKFTTQNFDA
jgi:hypothetical protein